MAGPPPARPLTGQPLRPSGSCGCRGARAPQRVQRDGPEQSFPPPESFAMASTIRRTPYERVRTRQRRERAMAWCVVLLILSLPFVFRILAR